ncbi:hypothetical protein ACHAW6_012616 [Cyclotella cf. meneghiniana]
MAHFTLTADVGELDVSACTVGTVGTMNERSAIAIVAPLPQLDMNTSSHRIKSIHRSNSIKMKTIRASSMSSLLVVSLLVLSTLTFIQAQQDELCSCSPRQYVFKLDLSATCPPNPPPFPPNEVFGPGVSDYTCATSLESTSAEDKTKEASNLGSAFVDGADEQVRGLSRNAAMDTDNDTVYIDDFLPPNIIDPEPIVIDSIQFLETNTNLDVINQDPSYVRDVNFVNGDVFNYTSISDRITNLSGEKNKIPGGISMVLRGYNGAGERVRNTFTIRFTNECGVPTFSEGEAIGWVIFKSLVPASKETCRSIQGSVIPTPSPSNGATPAQSNTLSPSSGIGLTSGQPTAITPSPFAQNTPSPSFGVTSGQPTESTPNPVAQNTPSPSFGVTSGQPTESTPNPAQNTPTPSSGNDFISGKPNASTPNPVARNTPEPSGSGALIPTKRPTRPTQSKPPTTLSYDFDVMYSEFELEPKADKMDAPVELSYQFYAPDIGAKPNKSGKSSSSGDKSGKSSNSSWGKSGKSSRSSWGKSGKSSNSSGGKSGKSSNSSWGKSGKSVRVRDSTQLKYEPVRGLRATLARMDLDRGAKFSNHQR